MSSKSASLSYGERLDFTVETALELIKESGDEYAIKEIAGLVIDAFAETLNTRIDMPERINKAVEKAKKEFANSGIKYKSHQRHCGENMGRTVLWLAWNVANSNESYRRALGKLKATIAGRRRDYEERRSETNKPSQKQQPHRRHRGRHERVA